MREIAKYKLYMRENFEEKLAPTILYKL